MNELRGKTIIESRKSPQASWPTLDRYQPSSDRLLTAEGLHKHFRLGGQDLHVLRGVDLDVRSGEWVVILGASGSGKSTLLHHLGGLDRPDGGRVLFDQTDIFTLTAAKLDRYRNSHAGFVFQFYHLLPELTALENVLIGAMIGHSVWSWPGRRAAVAEQATAMLERVGLKDRLRHSPSKLSGGERQRVAIARALVNEPDLLLADEPTGNLDAATGGQILELLSQLHGQGQTVVMVTHDERIASAADRRLLLQDGQLSRHEGA